MFSQFVSQIQLGFQKTTNIVSWNYQNCITSFNKSHPSGHQICLRFSPSLHSGYLRSDTNVRIDEAFQPQKHWRDILCFVKVIDLWVDISVTPQKKHVTSNRIGQLDIKYIFFCWGKKINEHSKLDRDHRKNGRAKQTPNKWRDHPLTGIMGGGWAQILSSVYHVWSKILHHLDVPGS